MGEVENMGRHLWTLRHRDHYFPAPAAMIGQEARRKAFFNLKEKDLGLTVCTLLFLQAVFWLLLYICLSLCIAPVAPGK